MYLLDSGLDIRVARLQQRLGLTIRPATSVGAQCQQLLKPPSTAAQQVADVQEHVVVLCRAHPARVCSSFVFCGLHSAVMACCMSEWMWASTLLPSSCSQQGAHGPHSPASAARDAGVNVGTDGCSACVLLARLPEADSKVQQYLEQASNIFHEVLPAWHQLEALIPPA
jgi:hypothetical protein